MNMKLISRDFYLRQLEAVRDIPDIKVITGIRRCGKSSLMDAFSTRIAGEAGVNVVRINLNLKRNIELRQPESLYGYVESRYRKDLKNYLFIDEVQMCQGFEEIISSIHEESIYDIYLTGSNAFLLSSDLATLFGGRVFEISIFPFSFAEYLQYHDSSDPDGSFDSYVRDGGMSGSYLYRTYENAMKYVEAIYETTIAKDIIKKFRVQNEDMLLRIGNFLMDNVGSLTSIRNVASKLISAAVDTNDKTAGAYIRYFCQSFLFYPVRRYDIRGKRYLEADCKYYLADLSFRFAVIGNKDPDYGHLYENLVAIELLRRGYEVYVGKLYQKEVDFVALKQGQRMYIQVSDNISGPETLKRELAPLLAIRDAYPKFLIARTRHDTADCDGVQVVDIARWLAGSQK